MGRGKTIFAVRRRSLSRSRSQSGSSELCGLHSASWGPTGVQVQHGPYPRRSRDLDALLQVPRTRRLCGNAAKEVLCSANRHSVCRDHTGFVKDSAGCLGDICGAYEESIVGQHDLRMQPRPRVDLNGPPDAFANLTGVRSSAFSVLPARGDHVRLCGSLSSRKPRTHSGVFPTASRKVSIGGSLLPRSGHHSTCRSPDCK